MTSFPLFGPSTPFYTGVFTSINTVPFTVMLDGHTYAVDLTKYRRSSQETLRDGVVQSNEPNDVLFNAQGAWARYRYSWFHGTGQKYGDLREDADPYRFYSSQGVDPWDDGKLKLLRAQTNVQSVTSSLVLMCIVGDYLFISDGATLYRTSDMTTFTTCTAPGGNVLAMTTDGTDLYVATTTVMKKYVAAATTPTTFSTPVTGNCSNVAFVANRLLMSKDNVLYEVGATGALTTLRTHYQSAFEWTTIFNIGSRIYIGGFAGARSELYTCVVDDTGVIVQGAEAAPLPPGELLHYGLAYAGVVLLGTSNGVRMATLGSDGTLTYGPLIAEGYASKAACVSGKFAWCSVDGFYGEGGGLIRLDLSTMTDTLQPAWASDEYTTEVTTITGVAFFDGCVAMGGSGGIYSSAQGNYIAAGALDSGLLSFGTVEPKGLIELEVTFEPLAAGDSVTATVYDENYLTLASRTYTTVGGTSMTVDLNGVEVEKVRVDLTLASTAQTGVTVLRWRMRAYPIPPAVQQWVVPLQVFRSNVVNDGEGQELTYEQLDEVEHLISLWASKTAVVYREGERGYQVRIDAYEYAPHDWRDAGDFFDGWMTVRLVEA